MEAEIPKISWEQAWCDANMRGDRRWQANRSTHRTYVGEGSRLVLWRAGPDGAPVTSELVTVSDLSLTPSTGIIFRLHMKERASLLVGSVPQRLAHTEIYVWVPGFADIRFTPVPFENLHAPRQLTVPMCVKTATNPKDRLREGAHYLNDQRSFMRHWPGVAIHG